MQSCLTVGLSRRPEHLVITVVDYMLPCTVFVGSGGFEKILGSDRCSSQVRLEAFWNVKGDILVLVNCDDPTL